MSKISFTEFLKLNESLIDLETVDNNIERMNSLILNYFGFLGLFSLRLNRAFVEYEESEGDLWLDTINHIDNHDISLSIKMAHENDLLSDRTAAKMLGILDAIKTKQIANKKDLCPNSIRRLLDEIDYFNNRPSQEIYKLIFSFHEGEITLKTLTAKLYELAKTDLHKPYTVEFRKLAYAGQYSRLFNVISESTKATNKSMWKVGDKCHGVYHGIKFTGYINDDTRPTPDYRNVMFNVTLDKPITLYGNKRTTVQIESNNPENELFFD